MRDEITGFAVQAELHDRERLGTTLKMLRANERSSALVQPHMSLRQIGRTVRSTEAGALSA
jgi:hypothetical protein